MSADAPLTLATLRRVVDELCRLRPQPPRLAAVATVLRRHRLGGMSTTRVAALLSTVATLVGDPAAERPGSAAQLTPRQLEELLAEVT
ncbi:hypothetical protein ACFY3U_26415 [Micromonospora sp. NPDC000089]|uniref:hypothetical protein n=1 Tax=unclassified Micromonospora TaxID=2617518 RepID=UPI0036BF754A